MLKNKVQKNAFIIILAFLLIASFVVTLSSCKDEQNNIGTQTDGANEDQTATPTDSDGNNASDTSSAGTEDGSSTADGKETDTIVNEAKKIFANGSFTCRFIRPEKPTDEERKIFDALRDKLNETVGKRPMLNTDFLAAGESYDENEFAILVGETDFEESKQLYSELGFGECSIQLIGRKLVIGFYDLETALSAINTLGDILAQSFDGSELAFNENMCFTEKSNDIIGALPAYSDGKIAGVVGGGNGSSTAIINETSLEAYNAYLSSLEKDGGYALYTNNTIADNCFATYTSEDYTITAIYTPTSAQARLTIESAKDNPLPALESEQYEVLCDSSVTQMGVESTGRQNGMCYIIKLADGSFMVFDGGDQKCVDLFINTIDSLADDKENITIAAWVITHLHNDHAYMLRDLPSRADFMERVTVERFIWNRPSKIQMANVDDKSENDELLYQSMKSFKGAAVYTAYAGQIYRIRNAVYTVYSTTEMLEPFVMGSYNDSCVVGLLEIDGRRMFFPGDSDRTQTKNLVKLYGKELKCDLLQVIHHGHNGGDTESYMLFDPITLLWPVGSARYYNEWDGNLPFSQWPCNEWFFDEKSSVEQIYVAGKDIVTLIIKELPSHND